MAQIPSPIQILQKCLDDLEYDLEKSKKMYEKKAILRTTHLLHKCNLLPRIGEYQLAILILKEYAERNTITEAEKASRRSED